MPLHIAWMLEGSGRGHREDIRRLDLRTITVNRQSMLINWYRVDTRTVPSRRCHVREHSSKPIA